MNLKIVMYMCAGLWDNDLVNQKEEQIKPVKITKQDQFGYETCCKMFLAEVDPDFGFESFRGVYGSMDAALDRIEPLIN